MNEEEKKLDLLTQTITGVPSYANYSRVYMGPDGITFKFFYVPPTGSGGVQLISTIVVSINLGIGTATTILNLVKQQSLQPQVDKKDKPKN